MPEFNPPEALTAAGFTDIEDTLANILDPAVKLLTAIESNPLARFLIPKQYQTLADELVHLLNAISGALHKTP